MCKFALITLPNASLLPTPCSHKQYSSHKNYAICFSAIMYSAAAELQIAL